MMKMSTGEGFPVRQGAGTGLDWFSVATEASGGGTPDLFRSPVVLGYMVYMGGRSTSGEPRGAHEGGGRALGGWARPLPLGSLISFLTCTPSLSGCFPSKNNFSRRFHSVSTPFDIPFLQNSEVGKKNPAILGWASG